MHTTRLFIAVLALHCGGTAVIDGDGDGGGGSSGAPAVGGGTTSGGRDDPDHTLPNPCGGAQCGEFCEVCAPDCTSGHCDGMGTCVPEQFGPNACPPASEVLMGADCSGEGFFCPSNDSCSGYLKCICGEWVLVNPC